MTRVSRSVTISLALALAPTMLASRSRTASGQTPDGPPESAWRVVREGGSPLVALSPDGTRLAYVEERPVLSPDKAPSPWIRNRSVVLVDVERGDALFRSDETRFAIAAVAVSTDASKLAIVRMMNGGNFFYGEPLQPDPNSRFDAVKQSTGGLGGGGIGEGGGRSVIDEQSRRSLALGSTVPPIATRLPITGGHYIPRSSNVEIWDVARKVGLGTSPSNGRPLIAAAFDTEAAELHAIGVDLRRAEIVVGRPDPAEPAVGEVKPRVFGFVDTGPTPMTSFSADGRRAATLRAATSDGRISIAIWKEGDESPTFLDRPASVAPQWVVAVAPDGKRFVTAGVGNLVHYLELRSTLDRTDDRQRPGGRPPRRVRGVRARFVPSRHRRRGRRRPGLGRRLGALALHAR